MKFQERGVKWSEHLPRLSSFSETGSGSGGGSGGLGGLKGSGIVRASSVSFSSWSSSSSEEAGDEDDDDEEEDEEEEDDELLSSSLELSLSSETILLESLARGVSSEQRPGREYRKR